MFKRPLQNHKWVTHYFLQLLKRPYECFVTHVCAAIVHARELRKSHEFLTWAVLAVRAIKIHNTPPPFIFNFFLPKKRIYFCNCKQEVDNIIKWSQELFQRNKKKTIEIFIILNGDSCNCTYFAKHKFAVFSPQWWWHYLVMVSSASGLCINLAVGRSWDWNAHVLNSW